MATILSKARLEKRSQNIQWQLHLSQRYVYTLQLLQEEFSERNCTST